MIWMLHNELYTMDDLGSGNKGCMHERMNMSNQQNKKTLIHEAEPLECHGKLDKTNTSLHHTKLARFQKMRCRTNQRWRHVEI
jgi:hypothetical protein